MRRLVLTLGLTLLALPVLAQTPQIGTRTGGGGTWAEVFFQGVDPSPRCTAIAEIPDALNWWRDEQGSVLFGTLLLSADTYYRAQGGLCEFAIRVDTADGPGAFVDEWAPRCGWSEESPHSKAKHVAKCIAGDLRRVLQAYRESQQADPDPGELAPPLE